MCVYTYGYVFVALSWNGNYRKHCWDANRVQYIKRIKPTNQPLESDYS